MVPEVQWMLNKLWAGENNEQICLEKWLESIQCVSTSSAICVLESLNTISEKEHNFNFKKKQQTHYFSYVHYSFVSC